MRTWCSALPYAWYTAVHRCDGVAFPASVGWPDSDMRGMSVHTDRGDDVRRFGNASNPFLPSNVLLSLSQTWTVMTDEMSDPACLPDAVSIVFPREGPAVRPSSSHSFDPASVSAPVPQSWRPLHWKDITHRWSCFSVSRDDAGEHHRLARESAHFVHPSECLV